MNKKFKKILLFFLISNVYINIINHNLYEIKQNSILLFVIN